MANKFLGYVREAKRLYKTGRYKTFAAAVKAASRQTGKSKISADKKRKAKPPGKRVAKKSKRVYYERRKNRSDKPKTVTGIKSQLEKRLGKALLDYELATTVRATKAAQKRKVELRKKLKAVSKK